MLEKTNTIKILNEEKAINNDPQLTVIIDEIELRAQVELAKLLREG